MAEHEPANALDTLNSLSVTPEDPASIFSDQEIETARRVRDWRTQGFQIGNERLSALLQNPDHASFTHPIWRTTLSDLLPSARELRKKVDDPGLGGITEDEAVELCAQSYCINQIIDSLLAFERAHRLRDHLKDSLSEAIHDLSEKVSDDSVSEDDRYAARYAIDSFAALLGKNWEDVDKGLDALFEHIVEDYSISDIFFDLLKRCIERVRHPVSFYSNEKTPEILRKEWGEGFVLRHLTKGTMEKDIALRRAAKSDSQRVVASLVEGKKSSIDIPLEVDVIRDYSESILRIWNIEKKRIDDAVRNGIIHSRNFDEYLDKEENLLGDRLEEVSELHFPIQSLGSFLNGSIAIQNVPTLNQDFYPAYREAFEYVTRDAVILDKNIQGGNGAQTLKNFLDGFFVAVMRVAFLKAAQDRGALKDFPDPIYKASDVLGISPGASAGEIERGYISALKRVDMNLDEEAGKRAIGALNLARMKMLYFVEKKELPLKENPSAKDLDLSLRAPFASMPLRQFPKSEESSVSFRSDSFSRQSAPVLETPNALPLRDGGLKDPVTITPGVAASRLGIRSSATRQEVDRAYKIKVAELGKRVLPRNADKNEKVAHERALAADLSRLNAAQWVLFDLADAREQSARILNVSLSADAVEVYEAHHRAVKQAMLEGEHIPEITRARDVLLTYIAARQRAADSPSTESGLLAPNLPPPLAAVPSAPLLPAVQPKLGFFARLGNTITDAVAAPGRVIRGAVFALGMALGIVGMVEGRNQSAEHRDAEATAGEMLRGDRGGADSEEDDDLGGFARGDMEDSDTINAYDFQMGDEVPAEEHREARTYTAKRGDTGEKIVAEAMRNAGVTPNRTNINFLAHELLRTNGFAPDSDGSDLRIGQELDMKTVLGHIEATKKGQEKGQEKGVAVVADQGENTQRNQGRDVMISSNGKEDVSVLSSRLVVTSGELVENSVGSSAEASGIAYFRPNEAKGKKYEELPTAKNPEHVMRKGEIIYTIIRKMLTSHGFRPSPGNIGYIAEAVLRKNHDRFAALVEAKIIKLGKNGDMREGLIPEGVSIDFGEADRIAHEMIVARDNGKKWKIEESAKSRGMEWPVQARMKK